MLLALSLLFSIPFVLGIAVLSFFRLNTFTLSFIELPGVAFCLGLCAFAFACTLGYLLRAPLLETVITTFFLGLFITIIQRKKMKVFFAQSQTLPKNVILWLIFGLFSLAVGYIGNFMNISSDSTHHLSYIIKFTSTGLLIPENFHLLQNSPIDELLTTYVYNSIFPLFASVIVLTSSDAVFVWKASAGIFSFVLLSAFYSTSIRFFNSYYTALLSIALLLIYFGIIITDFSGYSIFALRCLSYPNHIAGIVFIVLIGLIYHELKTEASSYKTNLTILFILAGALPLLHLQWWAYFLFVISIIYFILLWDKNSKLLYSLTFSSFFFLVVSAGFLFSQTSLLCARV
jgi:hypothetical protein